MKQSVDLLLRVQRLFTVGVLWAVQISPHFSRRSSFSGLNHSDHRVRSAVFRRVRRGFLLHEQLGDN